MRRTDREVSELNDILSILDKCQVMRLGLCADDKPYVVPLNFAYEAIGDRILIYFHCASQGRKLEIIAKNNNVCFEADFMSEIVKADIACDWGTRFQSVIGEGRVFILEDEDEKIHALNLIMKRYGFEGMPQYKSQEMTNVKVLQIVVDIIMGKRGR